MSDRNQTVDTHYPKTRKRKKGEKVKLHVLSIYIYRVRIMRFYKCYVPNRKKKKIHKRKINWKESDKTLVAN